MAAKHTPERVRAIQDILDFVRRYRTAWHAWRSGARDTLFPPGTYALRIYARVACGVPGIDERRGARSRAQVGRARSDLFGPTIIQGRVC